MKSTKPNTTLVLHTPKAEIVCKWERLVDQFEMWLIIKKQDWFQAWFFMELISRSTEIFQNEKH